MLWPGRDPRSKILKGGCSDPPVGRKPLLQLYLSVEQEICESVEAFHVMAAGRGFLLRGAADCVGAVGMAKPQFSMEFQSGLVVLLGSAIPGSGFFQLTPQPALYGFSFSPRIA